MKNQLGITYEVASSEKRNKIWQFIVHDGINDDDDEYTYVKFYAKLKLY